MAIAKRLNIANFLLFAFFVAFPFGQLARKDFYILEISFGVTLIDVIAVLAIPLSIFVKKKPKLWTNLKRLYFVFAVSFLFSIFLVPVNNYLLGFLYLLRLLAYGSLFLVIFDYVAESEERRSTIFKALLLILGFVALFGWIQYFAYPDLTALKEVGWDDHLYRLTGTFLDPGFTSLVLVFGVVISLVFFQSARKTRYLFLAVGFLLTILFTYSRAGYLASIAAVSVLYFSRRYIKFAFFAIFLAFTVLILLPKPEGSEGVKLSRTASIFQRLDNYKQTIDIFAYSPVFGIGYNNICEYRKGCLGIDLADVKHSCSGSDSSVLLVLATTGVVGLIVFGHTVLSISGQLHSGLYAKAFLASSVAVLVHSIFVNSLFYPWVLGYLAMLEAISVKE